MAEQPIRVGLAGGVQASLPLAGAGGRDHLDQVLRKRGMQPQRVEIPGDLPDKATEDPEALAQDLALTFPELSGFILPGSGTSPEAAPAPEACAERGADTPPPLPLARELELSDPADLDRFLEKVRAQHRWRFRFGGCPDLGSLRSFHRLHALAVLAHDPACFRRLSLLVAEAEAGGQTVPQAAREYLARFMGCLSRPITPAGMAAVLGTVWHELNPAMNHQERKEFGQEIWAYVRGRTPLGNPLRRARSLLSRYPRPQLREQLAIQTESTQQANI